MLTIFSERLYIFCRSNALVGEYTQKLSPEAKIGLVRDSEFRRKTETVGQSYSPKLIYQFNQTRDDIDNHFGRERF